MYTDTAFECKNAPCVIKPSPCKKPDNIPTRILKVRFVGILPYDCLWRFCVRAQYYIHKHFIILDPYECGFSGEFLHEDARVPSDDERDLSWFHLYYYLG
jgi:hypothetical protein